MSYLWTVWSLFWGSFSPERASPFLAGPSLRRVSGLVHLREDSDDHGITRVLPDAASPAAAVCSDEHRLYKAQAGRRLSTP